MHIVTIKGYWHQLSTLFFFSSGKLISLRTRAVIGYYRIFQCRANFRIRNYACAKRYDFARFAHERRQFFAWCGSVDNQDSQEEIKQKSRLGSVIIKTVAVVLGEGTAVLPASSFSLKRSLKSTILDTMYRSMIRFALHWLSICNPTLFLSSKC